MGADIGSAAAAREQGRHERQGQRQAQRFFHIVPPVRMLTGLVCHEDARLPPAVGGNNGKDLKNIDRLFSISIV
jgi:hypothetical protein